MLILEFNVHNYGEWEQAIFKTNAPRKSYLRQKKEHFHK